MTDKTESTQASSEGSDRLPRGAEPARGAPKPKRSAIPWLITAGLAALIAAVVVYAATREPAAIVQPPKKLASVQTATVRTQRYREALTLPAALEADRTATLSPELGGKLGRWLAKEGEAVKEGQVVAEFDTDTIRANLQELDARKKSAALMIDQARVGLEGARVGLESAKKDREVRDLDLRAARSALELSRTEHERAQMLVDRKVMDQARLDTARNTFTQATVGVRQAEERISAAELGIRAAEVRVREAENHLAHARAGLDELDAAARTLGVQLDKAELRAPISGRLEEQLVEPGEFVAAGTPVGRLYDLRHLRAVVPVPDRYVAFLDPTNPALAEFIRRSRPGSVQEVAARIIVPGLPKLTGGENPGLEIPAEIVHIAQAADPNSNTFKVELRVANPGMALKHGNIVRARIEYLTYPQAVVIPVRAVQVTETGPRVLVAERSGGGSVARVRDIEPGSVSEDDLLVLKGLKEGDRLIVAGWKGLVDGEELNVVVEDGALTTADRDEGRR